MRVSGHPETVWLAITCLALAVGVAFPTQDVMLSRANWNQAADVVNNTFTTLTIPSVTNLTVTQYGRTGNLILNWTPASPSSGYTIYEGNPDPVSGSCPTTVTYYLVTTLSDPNANTFTDSNRIGNNMPPGYPTFNTYCYQVYTLYGSWTSAPTAAVIKVAAIRGAIPAAPNLGVVSESAVVTSLPTQTWTPSPTRLPTRTQTPAPTRTRTPSPTQTVTSTATATARSTRTSTATLTPTITRSPTGVATVTSTPVVTTSATRTGTLTPTRVFTATETVTASATAVRK